MKVYIIQLGYDTESRLVFINKKLAENYLLDCNYKYHPIYKDHYRNPHHTPMDVVIEEVEVITG